jgi:heme exporter protein A
MLELVNLGCRRGERRLFSGLTMTMPAGKVVAVTGNNGSGKTSLLRMLCGLLPPDEGVILWKGRNISTLKESYLGQLLHIGHLNGLTGDLTAVENLQMTVHLSGDRATDADTRAALLAMGLPDRAHHLPIRILSQGQKRRVALARMWLTHRPLWILDEPFAALDAAATDCLTRRVQTHVEAGGAVVLATHDEVNIGSDYVQQMRLTG